MTRNRHDLNAEHSLRSRLLAGAAIISSLALAACGSREPQIAEDLQDATHRLIVLTHDTSTYPEDRCTSTVYLGRALITAAHCLGKDINQDEPLANPEFERYENLEGYIFTAKAMELPAGERQSVAEIKEVYMQPETDVAFASIKSAEPPAEVDFLELPLDEISDLQAKSGTKFYASVFPGREGTEQKSGEYKLLGYDYWGTALFVPTELTKGHGADSELCAEGGSGGLLVSENGEMIVLTAGITEEGYIKQNRNWYSELLAITYDFGIDVMEEERICMGPMLTGTMIKNAFRELGLSDES